MKHKWIRRGSKHWQKKIYIYIKRKTIVIVKLAAYDTTYEYFFEIDGKATSRK